MADAPSRLASAPVLVALVLLALLLLLMAGYRFLLAILVRNLTGNPEVHLDFSSREGVEEPHPERQREGAPWVLFLHEFSATGASYRKYAGFLEDAGLRILAPDLPQGSHEGPRLFLQESDVEVVRGHMREAARLADADGVPLYVFGVSRGAGAALAALGEEPELPVRAAVVDGFFSTPDVVEAMIRRFAPIYVGPAARLLPGAFVRFTARRGLAAAAARLGTRFPFAGEVLERLPCPVLFLHGGRDRNVSPRLAPGYAARAPEGSRAFVVPRARHNQACLEDPEGYAEAVSTFLAEAGAGDWLSSEGVGSPVSREMREKR